MARATTCRAAAALLLGLLTAVSGEAVAGFPFVTEDAGTQGTGNAEVEFTGQRAHDSDGSRTTSPGNTITMGLAPRTDLAIGYTYDFTTAADGAKARGMGPVEATLKTIFLDGKSRIPALGVKAGLSLPVSEGDETAVLLTGVAQWSPEPLTVFANIGADIGTRLAGNDERTTALRASVAGAYEFRKEWYLLSELLWEKQSAPSAPASAEWLVGGKKEIADRFSVEGGIRWGLTADSPHVTCLFGITMKFHGDPAGVHPPAGEAR